MGYRYVQGAGLANRLIYRNIQAAGFRVWSLRGLGLKVLGFRGPDVEPANVFAF